MAVATHDEFVKRYPQFSDSGRFRIEKALADAALYVDVVAFGVRADLAIEYKAASLLVSGRYGQIAPLPNKSETNEWEKRFLELRAMVPKKGILL